MTTQPSNRIRRPDRICGTCGTSYHPPTNKSKYCGRECAAIHRAETLRARNTAARGTEIREYIDKLHDIVMYRLPDGRSIAKHRYLFQQYHNIKLRSWHRLTFADGNQRNFDKDNIILSSKILRQYFDIYGKLPGRRGPAYCTCGAKKEGIAKKIDGTDASYCKPCTAKRQKIRRRNIKAAADS